MTVDVDWLEAVARLTGNLDHINGETMAQIFDDLRRLQKYDRENPEAVPNISADTAFRLEMNGRSDLEYITRGRSIYRRVKGSEHPYSFVPLDPLEFASVEEACAAHKSHAENSGTDVRMFFAGWFASRAFFLFRCPNIGCDLFGTDHERPCESRVAERPGEACLHCGRELRVGESSCPKCWTSVEDVPEGWVEDSLGLPKSKDEDADEYDRD